MKLPTSEAALKSIARRVLIDLPPAFAAVAASALLPRVAPDRHLELATLGAARPTLGVVERARLLPILRANALRSSIIDGLARHGELGLLRDRVSVLGLEHLPPGPAVLVGWHLGPSRIVKHALRWRGLDPVVVAASGENDPGIIRVDPKGGPEHRAAVALAALQALRAGRHVIVMGDGPLGTGGESVPVLGHRPEFRAGLATLAHQRRVPLIPIWSAWRDRRIEVVIEPPLRVDPTLSRPAFVAAVAQALGGWLGALHVREPTILTRVHTQWLTRR